MHIVLATATLGACSVPETEHGHDTAKGLAPSTAQTGGGGSAGSGGDPDEPADPGPTDPARPAPGTWILVSAGSFQMGAPPTESCNHSVNQILHPVTLAQSFEMSATEVTWTEYAAAVGSLHPSAQRCSDCPVQSLSWHGAAATCNAYSEYADLVPCYACQGEGDLLRCTQLFGPDTCHGYRLPTEAEWEYAYRAGTGTPVYSGDIAICGGLDPNVDAVAWFLYNAGGGTHPAASKLANDWGFFDMSGNVWEWTHDGYVTDRSTLPTVDPIGTNDEDVRVMRGGSYNCLPEEVRAAHRSGIPAQIGALNVGVRCARTLK